MEEEIDELLNTTSLTDIILKYDNLEQKIINLEKKIMNIINIDTKQLNKQNDKNILKLKILLDKSSDSKIKESSIEELIKLHDDISKLCLHNYAI